MLTLLTWLVCQFSLFQNYSFFPLPYSFLQKEVTMYSLCLRKGERILFKWGLAN